MKKNHFYLLIILHIGVIILWLYDTSKVISLYELMLMQKEIVILLIVASPVIFNGFYKLGVRFPVPKFVWIPGYIAWVTGIIVMLLSNKIIPGTLCIVPIVGMFMMLFYIAKILYLKKSTNET